MYVGTVALNGKSKRILIAESPTTPLLGTDRLWGFSLYIEFQSNGTAEITRLPEDTD